MQKSRSTTPRRILHILVVICALVLSACQFSAEETRRPVDVTPSGELISLYFTAPDDPQSSSLRGGPDARLARAISEAQVSVDLAVLDLNLWSIRDALLEAHRRGIPVRVVVESEYLQGREVQELVEAGIPVLGDRREGLMHNKFTIIDRREVWAGSMNYTINDAYRNDNSLIRIRSTELANNFLVEFEEMFVDDKFGPGSPANTTSPQVEVGGSRVQICFAPDDGCLQKLSDALASARHSIHFLAFSFTSDPLGELLRERAASGVEVAGVMEASQVRSNSGTEFDLFRRAGLDVRRDGNPRNMHHKAMVIDGRILVIGSYNFSHFAETRNDENLLIIDDAELAAQLEAEFSRVFATAGD